jgi:hypothetical protein
MRRTILSGTVILLAAFSLVGAREKKPVQYDSPTQVKGAYGAWRWKVKVDDAEPPDTIAEKRRMTPSDIGAWDAPKRKIDTKSPRKGREKRWFQLTGRVVLVKAERDGDLHIQLRDADKADSVQVVVEVPAKHHSATAPWGKIRETVFSWTNTKFPFTTIKGQKLELKKHPVIQVIGKAFCDGKHAKKSTPNRRKKKPNFTVWEIHPVMRLTVVKEDG